MCEDCGRERPIEARGLCHTCYAFWYRRFRKTGHWHFEGVRQRGFKCGYCGKPAHARRLCRKHYNQMYQRGLLEVRLAA